MNFKESFKKVLAFTLAETLIVIGIIGVVAALTIPNLNSSTADREKVAKLKKVYAQLNEAFERAQAVYGPIEEWGLVDDDIPFSSARVSNRLKEFLKLSKDCSNTDNSCINSKFKYLHSDTLDDMPYAGNYQSFILADGTSVMLCVEYFNTKRIVSILINIDGAKSLNIYGKNLFSFFITENNNSLMDHVHAVQELDPETSEEDVLQTCFAEGYTCSSWVLKSGNMDYLKADENGKCNNSDIVLDATTNTSCK